MPFKSSAQRAFMFIHHPKIAKRWAKENPRNAHSRSLPKHVGGRAKIESKRRGK